MRNGAWSSRTAARQGHRPPARLAVAWDGERVATATRIIVEIVAKSPDQIGFAVLPRRWVVERFFAWIGRNRRLAKDFEASIDSARAFRYAASVMLLSRRIARHAWVSKPTLRAMAALLAIFEIRGWGVYRRGKTCVFRKDGTVGSLIRGHRFR
jgi:transposase